MHLGTIRRHLVVRDDRGFLAGAGGRTGWHPRPDHRPQVCHSPGDPAGHADDGYRRHPQADYDIAVRQFKQQILPGGIWKVASRLTPRRAPRLPADHGVELRPRRRSDARLVRALGGAVGVAPAPNSSFNYPAFTVENIINDPTKVRWINQLVKDPVDCYYSTTPAAGSCNYLSHLLPVDQTLHWANPSNADCYATWA